MEELSIKVNILGRTYPLKIRKDDEERVREAARLISDRIRDYEQQYAVTDKVDLLSMCALQIANELLTSRDNLSAAARETTSHLDDMDALISQALQKHTVL